MMEVAFSLEKYHDPIIDAFSEVYGCPKDVIDERYRQVEVAYYTSFNNLNLYNEYLVQRKKESLRIDLENSIKTKDEINQEFSEYLKCLEPYSQYLRQEEIYVNNLLSQQIGVLSYYLKKTLPEPTNKILQDNFADFINTESFEKKTVIDFFSQEYEQLLSAENQETSRIYIYIYINTDYCI